MKNKHCFVLALACSLLSSPALADADCKKLVMTGNSEYPPVSWRDRTQPSKITSLAVDLVEMAMKEVGVPVESRYVGPWKRAHLAMRNGEVDVIQNAYMNEERKTYLEYTSTPYIMDPTVIFVKKGHKIDFKKKEDLVGLSGAAPLGESYGDDFDNFAKAKLKIDLTTSIEVAFRKLLAGRSQYVVFGLYPGVAAADTAGIGDQIEALPNSVINEGMYIAISKKSPCVKYKDHLSAKITEYVKQGIPEKLLEKYKKVWKEQSKMKIPEN